MHELNVKEHILIISPENITASLFVLPILQSFIQLIGQLNFKKIYIIDSDNYAAMIKQGLSSYGVTANVRYVKSVREALNE
ncbi:MAG: hypothetical protein A2Y23_12595 [Clostridiales bacterium GWB2_37_7]|nr:MAG: hypothetical protein A2Y23_12595 [Clostridiales bacterium GWB2_37_7]